MAAAIILTLVGVLAATGKKIRQRSEVELTQSTLAVLDAALEVYYAQHDAFVPMASSEVDFEAAIGGPVTIQPPAVFPPGVIPEDRCNWRNAAMYYFLNREPKSRAILQSLSSRMLTHQDAAGVDLLIQIPTGADPIPWIRVVDAWETPLDYRYDPSGATFPEAANFPVLYSGGPDQDVFKAADNISNL